MESLTDIQQQVYDFIRSKIASGDVPSVREIAQKFGYKSKRAAEHHIGALIHKGWLQTTPGKARSLRLVKDSPAETFSIPFLGSIPAGTPVERNQREGECIAVCIESVGFKPTRNTFALRVTGDSMIGRFIVDGDIVILEHGPEPRNGQIVAALIDGKNTLKTFVIKGGKPFLKAENPKYPTLIPSEELVIQGVFKALIRKAKE